MRVHFPIEYGESETGATPHAPQFVWSHRGRHYLNQYTLFYPSSGSAVSPLTALRAGPSLFPPTRAASCGRRDRREGGRPVVGDMMSPGGNAASAARSQRHASAGADPRRAAAAHSPAARMRDPMLGAASPPSALAGSSPHTPTRAYGAGGGRQAVRVVVRVRPLLAHEIASADAPVLRVPDPTALHAVVGRQGDKEVLRSYRFSSVCGPGTSQEAFFDSSGVRGLIDEALEGINCSVFAYGQVGCSYWLMTAAARPPICPCCCRCCCRRAQARRSA